MADEPAVFVVGIGRSGTSALRTALHRLPAFRALEARSPETRVFAQPRNVERILERPGRRLLRYMLGNQEEARALLATLDAMHLRFARPRRAWARRTSDPVRAWRLLGHHHRVRLFFHHAGRARRARRILEKTPHHWERMPEMRATFPRARIIMCIRHPVEVMSSLRKRHQRESQWRKRPERIRWLEIDAPTMVDRFGRVARALLAERAARPQTRYLLRYEDLTRDPEATFRALCGFVGEPFDAEALLERVDEGRDAHGSPVKGSRIAPNRKRWEEWVDEKEARAVENGVEAELEQLGYARYTSP
ncbi:MAG: sulfotransferase family protein [Myxococcota bacterium]